MDIYILDSINMISEYFSVLICLPNLVQKGLFYRMETKALLERLRARSSSTFKYGILINLGTSVGVMCLNTSELK